MKAAVLVFETKPYGIYIAHWMKEAGFLGLVIVELASLEKSKKLKRMLFKKFWRLPLNILDVLAAWAYMNRANGMIKRELVDKKGLKGFPKGVEVFYTDSINSEKCIKKLGEFKSDIAIVVGTSILSKKTIEKCGKYCLNVHGGLLPKYRNVRGEFWAAYTGDLDKYGVSLVHLDPGLDTGDIALEGIVKLKGNETLAEMKLKNVQLGAELVIKALEMVAEGRALPRRKQDNSKKSFFPTPGFLDYLMLFLKKGIRP